MFISNSTWIILAVFLVAVNAGLLGNFLILRKQAMIGDAISHAVLPGIAIAFMLTNTTHPVVLFVGAAVTGMLATLLISFLEQQIGIGSDVATGITFTAFFALGIVLVALYTQKADLDQQCVLYGHPILVPFDRWVFRGHVMGPKAIYLLAGLLLYNALFIGSCFPMLVITSFDPHFSRVIGLNTNLWHYMLMVSTAITTVCTFKIVGAVLVVALLVVPASIAYLLTHSLKQMIAYTLLIDAWIAWAGYHLAVWLEGSVSGAMVTVAGICLVLALLITSLQKRASRATISPK